VAFRALVELHTSKRSYASSWAGEGELLVGAQREDLFANFARKRKSLNESIDEAGKAIDRWFEHQPLPPNMVALANLEVLLKTRRDLLQELINLDDEFMVHLLMLRGEQPAPGDDGVADRTT
jgi:hypothetical protein